MMRGLASPAARRSVRGGAEAPAGSGCSTSAPAAPALLRRLWQPAPCRLAAAGAAAAAATAGRAARTGRVARAGPCRAAAPAAEAATAPAHVPGAPLAAELRPVAPGELEQVARLRADAYYEARARDADPAADASSRCRRHRWHRGSALPS